MESLIEPGGMDCGVGAVVAQVAGATPGRAILKSVGFALLLS
jgi:hypothetical protein